ncbi:MobP1 family relaxase [Campylobacter helveticus]|uniref:MobP1 family relaxase n=1 Tax=Campylobacter helveticus TaxID=28898 RepID=UPI0022EAD386|nr:MobP1 family relaxase [Campylobacter helveticus]
MSFVPIHIKIQEEEWKKYKAKKVYDNIQKVSSYPLNFKQRYSKTTININPQRSKEVLVKITSSSKHFQGLCKHIDYISRQGKLEILTSDIETYMGKEENLEVKRIFKNCGRAIPNEKEMTKEIRQTYNIVFSMKEHSSTPPEKLKTAAFNTLKELYPNNFFVMTLHLDTDNPHCHICLKIAGHNGDRIDIRKADLTKMRQLFAKNLNDLGVKASATSRRQELGIDIAKRQQILDELKSKNKQKIKAHHYKVLDFGEAKYEFDEANKMSYFVKYLSSKGETYIWGLDLKRVIEEKQIQKGEYVRFAKIGFKAQEQSFKKKIKNKWYQVKATKKVPIWDASIFNRDEKSKFDKLPAIKEEYTLIPIQKENNERTTTTRRKRARHFARRIHCSNLATHRRKELAKSAHDLPKLSQIPVVSKLKPTTMLLHTNALNKLEFRKQRQSNQNLRRADNGIDRT